LSSTHAFETNKQRTTHRAVLIRSCDLAGLPFFFSCAGVPSGDGGEIRNHRMSRLLCSESLVCPLLRVCRLIFCSSRVLGTGCSGRSS
jgi:hypothetical protein